MALFTWWRGDPIPELSELDGFHAAPSDDRNFLVGLTGLDLNEVQRRLQHHHRPYVAYLGTEPVAYGWVALEGAEIGELEAAFKLAVGDRYPWDFATLPTWRGRGIYPRLLQEILRAEQGAAERFWIIHAPENGASQAGIQRAGFRFAGELSFRRAGGAAIVPGELHGRANVGAALLSVPVIEEVMITTAQEEPLAPCWRCVLDARQAGGQEDGVACWSSVPSGVLALHGCACGCS
jgi:GNAT superfamily N-acetyltransferase